MFRGLSEQLLERLASQLHEVSVPAGAWIMRQGESGDGMFIVTSGRVEVVDEGPPEVLLRPLRRGDIFGELALLGLGTRSASARARRDSELFKLARVDFESLIERAPAFAVGLVRAMGAQLAESRSRVAVHGLPRTLAVVGLDRAARSNEVAERLTEALARHGSVAVLREGSLSAIDQAVRDAERVVLRGGNEPGEAWTDLCLREGDLVLAVSSTGRPDSRWAAEAHVLRGCELLVLGAPLADGVHEMIQPREVQAIAEVSRLGDTLEATARRLAGQSLGVVLSGGGARAFAHVGVLDELRRAGVRFDRIAGTSLGALLAAAAACGFPPSEMYEQLERYFVKVNPSNDWALPVYSLIRGSKTRRLVHEGFSGRKIEELDRRFFCVSCDLVAREVVVHRAGPVADAVYSSLAIPGVFPPVATADGRLLVDGGVLDNLPVATMASRAEGPVIAVDVTGRPGRQDLVQGSRFARFARPVRRALTGSEAEIPRLGETLVRAVTVGSIDTAAAARKHAEVVITPAVEGVGLMDWKALARMQELGRAAARAALAGPEMANLLGI